MKEKEGEDIMVSRRKTVQVCTEPDDLMGGIKGRGGCIVSR